MSSSNRIICPSHSLEDLVKNAFSHSKTTIIPNGFDINRFLPGKAKENRILILTRMFKRKGVQYFIKAIEGIDFDYEVHIVGDGPYLDDLKSLAVSLGVKIKFWGFLDNQSEKLKNLLEASKIFVFPSEAENFPIVLLEAMSTGMAIITTKGTGCEEVVSDTALLVKPKDANGLRDALLKLIHNPFLCEKLGKMARKRIIDNFSWEAVAKRYLKEYEKHIKNPNEIKSR